MAVVTKTVLKSYFEDGQEPDENKFINLIDTMAVVDANGNFTVTGGLRVGSSSPVTTAGRIKATESIFAGGTLVLGNVDGAAQAGGIAMYVGAVLKGTIHVDASWMRLNQSTGIPVYTPEYLYGVKGLRAGSAAAVPAGGDVTYSADLKADRGGTDYTGYIYVPIPGDGRTHSSWNGDAKSDINPGALLNLQAGWSTNFPAGVRAVAVRLIARDSGTFPAQGLFLSVGPTQAYPWAVSVRPLGGDAGAPNGYWAEACGNCPTDGNDIYVRVEASGTNTMDCTIEITGYWV